MPNGINSKIPAMMVEVSGTNACAREVFEVFGAGDQAGLALTAYELPMLVRSELGVELLLSTKEFAEAPMALPLFSGW
jgi:hypothetical protein